MGLIKRYMYELIGIVLILLLIFAITYGALHERDARKNIESAINTSRGDSVIYIKVKGDSSLISKVNTIEANQNTLKVLFPAIIGDFEHKTNRNIRNLQNVLTTQINYTDTFYIPYKDTTDQEKAFYYHDSFNTIEGTIKKDGVDVQVKHQIYLTKFTFKSRNKAPWYKPWLWGRHLTTTIESKNPKDSIVNIQDLNITK